MKAIFLFIFALVILADNTSASSNQFKCVDTRFGRYCSATGCVEYESEVRCGPGCVLSEHGHVCGDNCTCNEIGCNCSDSSVVTPMVTTPVVVTNNASSGMFGNRLLPFLLFILLC